MDFESPDVEREFPGLYLSESSSGKRSQEGDFSDDAHERSTKKDLLIGKRKDKKESKKDQGYAALEGESSPEEDLDVKSPCKSKKSKSFKFPTIKEKREKSREKDGKEKEKSKEKDGKEKEKDKDKHKERDIDRDKEKKKESKSKLKLKDKKKAKTADDTVESIEEMPVFGVPLSVAVQRSHCHDGVEIPVVIRDCVDYVQDSGLAFENIYKISGMKSKVQQLRTSYNKREIAKLSDYDLPTVTSLLKTFLRELPDPLLTSDLTPRFEDAASIKELAAREQELSVLLSKLPSCNSLCLSWIMRHLECVIANECHNKMGTGALGTVFGPVFQTSPRVVISLLSHCNALFPNIKIVRYIPPLSAGCTSLPSSKEAIAGELTKQESLLNQIHSEMNHGYTVRSDQLWEVQRFITLLKRKLRSLEKAQESSSQINQTVDKTQAIGEPSAAFSITTDPSSSKVTPITPPGPSAEKIDFQLQVATEESRGKNLEPGSDIEDTTIRDRENICERSEHSAPKDDVDSNAPIESLASCGISTSVISAGNPSVQDSVAPANISDQSDHASVSESEEKNGTIYLEMEHIELLKLQNYLLSCLYHEREEIEALRAEFKSLTCDSSLQNISKISDAKQTDENPDIPGNEDVETDKMKKERLELLEQNDQLMQDRLNLVRQIMLEQEACISLRVQLDQLRQAAET